MKTVAMNREAMLAVIEDLEQIAANDSLRDHAFGWLIGMAQAQVRFGELVELRAEVTSVVTDLRDAYLMGASIVHVRGIDAAGPYLRDLVEQSTRLVLHPTKMAEA